MKSQAATIILSAMTFALGVTGCGSGKPQFVAALNQSAALTGQLPANPLQWGVITSAANTADATMSTLYGNDLAIQHARTNSQHNYPAGSAIALVTWTQKDDPRYFGARIPSQVKSVEFVFVSAAADGHSSYSYQRFAGAPLKQSFAQQYKVPSDRAAELLSQRAAVMP